jgi:hypothetical protein
MASEEPVPNGIRLQPGDREVLGVPERVPVVLTCDPPRGAARYPVTGQPYLYPRHPFVCFQGRRLVALACTNIVQQQL